MNTNAEDLHQHIRTLAFQLGEAFSKVDEHQTVDFATDAAELFSIGLRSIDSDRKDGLLSSLWGVSELMEGLKTIQYNDVAAARSYATLDEIGKAMGITRQAVSQRFKNM